MNKFCHRQESFVKQVLRIRMKSGVTLPTFKNTISLTKVAFKVMSLETHAMHLFENNEAVLLRSYLQDHSITCAPLLKLRRTMNNSINNTSPLSIYQTCVCVSSTTPSSFCYDASCITATNCCSLASHPATTFVKTAIWSNQPANHDRTVNNNRQASSDTIVSFSLSAVHLLTFTWRSFIFLNSLMYVV